MTNVAYWNLIAVHRWLDARQPLFSIVKYSIFALLAVTSFFYIRDGIRAAQQTLGAQSTFWDALTMYAISVDYIAWLYLLIIIVTTYYSLFGRSLDLIDSIHWLMAFLFIEINITHWNEEDSHGLPTVKDPAR